MALTVSKTNDGSRDLLTSQAPIESDVPSCSMRNIQVYKTGAELKANRERVRKHRVNRVEIQIRTLDSAADRTRTGNFL